MSQVKGTCVKSVIEFGSKRGGSEKWKDILDELKPEAQSLFSRAILPGDWYALDAYHQLLVAMAKHLSGGDPKLGIEIGRKIMEDGLGGVYKVLLGTGLISPKLIMSNANLLWKRYFDKEILTIAEVDIRHVRIKVTAQINPPKVYCHALLGGILQSLEMVGAKNTVGQELNCRQTGCESCEFLVNWT